MSTIHLTKQEKAELTKFEIRKGTAEYQNRQHAKSLKQKKKKEDLALKLAAELAADPPPLDLIAMFGPDHTSLSETVRPANIPLDSNIPEDVPRDSFIEDIAAQPGFRETLGENIEDVRIAKFLKLMGEVENRSMTWCARSCGLTNADMARIWRNSKLTRAFFRIVNRMEAVADKVVEDAMGSKKSCPRCDGFGRVEVPPAMREFFEDAATAICPNCEGRKVVPSIGSAPDKQLIWEKVGWSKKGSGLSVNVNMGDHSVDATINEMDGLEGEVGQVVEHQA